MFTLNLRPSRFYKLYLGLGLLLQLSSFILAQETRSTIQGTVKDSTGAVVAGASIIVTNTETNSSVQLTTGSNGYYEAAYQLAGTYTITASASGFKKTVRQGFVLGINTRTEADLTLEIGAASESISVTTEAPLLDTTTASGSTTLTNRQVMDLPVLNNSALILARTVPGIQWTAAANYLGPHSNVGASAVNTAGGVGGTEFSMDGVPNAGPSRRVGALPYADTVAEIKIETSPFDASKGHSSGASISVVTKSGTNAYHGSLTWQHWQQRWNATPTTLNQTYWGAINNPANASTAEALKTKERQQTGRSNNYAGVVGGPVRVPWLYNGKDRLFFFFSYNGLKEVKTEEPLAVRFTVPTAKQRTGDFSDLLAIDPVRYQIYDPRTARSVTGGVCGTGNTCVVRDPFVNNQVPIINPMTAAYLKLIPLPNNVPGVVGSDGLNNYLAAATPFNWDFANYGNRIDWVVSQKQRVFGKWSYQNFLEDRADWTYETARGLHQNGLNRNNIAVVLDHVYTFNTTTILNTSVAWNRYRDGNTQNAVQRSFGPDSVGLPSYLTAFAGDAKHLPVLDFSDGGNSDFSRTFSTATRYSIGTVRGELTKILKSHSLRFGYDLRQHYRQFNNPGNTSGVIQPRNTYLRQTNTTTTNGVGLLGLEWASFLLGAPGNSVSVTKNDSYYLTNPYYGFYMQDDWRVTPKLTLNLGLRMEREGGFKERYNRAIIGVDLNADLPISAAAQAAYTTAQIPELAASQFIVKGGSTYLGQNGNTASHLSENLWLPRVGAVYQLNDKTVIRGGYGIFYDTNNVLNNDLNQLGYSRTTATAISNDNGLTFTSSNLTSAACRASTTACTTIFSDPFPTLSDGKRFLEPVGNTLGLMAGVGRSLGFIPNDWKHARQQRWRLSLQRELSRSMVLEVAYLGSYSDKISIGKRIDALPEQYWATGTIRNNTLANNLNSTVANPFRLSNFTALQTSNPVLYQDMAGNGFFTATTRAKSAILRPYGHLNNATNARTPIGEVKYHDVEVTLNKRFSQGMMYSVSFIRSWNKERTVFENEFDSSPVWRESNSSRPNHFMFNALYELPFGKGKRFLADSKIANAVVGGWQVSSIYHLQSGPIYDTGNWFFYGTDSHALTKSRDERTTDAWFNWQLLPGATRDYTASNRTAYETRIRTIVPQSVLTSMGSICGSGNNVACTYENVTPTNFQPNSFHRRIFPTRLSWLRTSNMNQVDMNIARNFALTEKLKIQFRVDFINALNHVTYQGPNTDITSTSFGKVTAQDNTPRWIQFMMRFTF